MHDTPITTGTRKGGRPQAPCPPANLTIIAQGSDSGGLLHLHWNKSAYVKGRFVRFYTVERRVMDKTGPGQWQIVASIIDNKAFLKDQPRGIQLEYRTKAINKGGKSSASNTISVIL